MVLNFHAASAKFPLFQAGSELMNHRVYSITPTHPILFRSFRLVPKPNCVKVPKEICVNTKKNPRRVKKPVVKEWCYRPKDLLENPGTIPEGLLNNNSNDDNGGDEDPQAVPSQRRRQKKLFKLFY